MKTSEKIAFIIVTALAVDFAEVYFRNQKAFKTNLEIIKRQEEKIERLAEVATYFTHKLDEAQVPFDEFDRMVINTIID